MLLALAGCHLASFIMLVFTVWACNRSIKVAERKHKETLRAEFRRLVAMYGDSIKETEAYRYAKNEGLAD